MIVRFASGAPVAGLLLLVFNQRIGRPGPGDIDVRANRALVGHLVFDTGVLFAFFWAIGGATNPFVSLFLLPVAFAGAALDIRGALAVTGVCVAGYTALLWRYLWHLGHPMSVIGFERHVIGMWATFVLAAGLLLVFLLALAERVRAGERELAAQRERLMRDDAVVGVATVAAGAAHALNTPLSTILIAAESLQDEPNLPPDVQEDIATIHNQAELAARELRGTLIQMDKVGFSYTPGSKPLMSNLDFELSMDSRVALVGPNGCGKSTFLNLLAGSLSPTTGSVDQAT